MDKNLKRLLIILCVMMAVIIAQNTAIITLMNIDRCGGQSASVPAGEADNGGEKEIHAGETMELVPEVIGPDLRFSMSYRNTTDAPLTLRDIVIIDCMNGEKNGEGFVIPAQNLLPPDALTVEPGEEVPFEDWHPAFDALQMFNERHYVFVMEAPDGSEMQQDFAFFLDPVRDQITEQPQAGNTDYSQDSGKDLLTLRHDAGFDAEVFPGVHWVPARVLGESRYTNAEVFAMLQAEPQEKREAVSTLYEALQLYQIGNFYASDDNIRIEENGVNWEHHKPGYDAVRTNTGCCATDSNWLRYILDGDYDEVGYIATSQRDGSGHIYNYILHGGMYYFIDLTHYRTDWVATAVESGSMDDYNSSDRVLGNIHCARSVDDFVRYVQEAFGDPPGMMFKYTAENCLAIDSRTENNGVVIIYEDAPGVNIEVIFDDPGDALSHVIVPSPANRPDFGVNPDYNF